MKEVSKTSVKEEILSKSGDKERQNMQYGQSKSKLHVEK
jgi:hypothetical protein